MKLCMVVGARPNFVKIAPIIEALEAYNQSATDAIQYFLVHTGQHYDTKLSKLFFEELQLPPPDVNLEVGSGSHASQTAEIMRRFEPVCVGYGPSHVLVVGDVNSTIACALVAAKLGIKVIHVEAGLRSFDRTMPEEINRILTDSISDILFTTEESANRNLMKEGIPPRKMFFVGNVMIDTLMKHVGKAQSCNILKDFGLSEKIDSTGEEMVRPYVVLTLHRPSNVDSMSSLLPIVEAVIKISNCAPVIFPVHPRVLTKIRTFGLASHFSWSYDKSHKTAGNEVHCKEPLGYIEFLKLIGNAALVLTDSGGIQEETTALNIPCITIRKNTERPITITHGTNVLSGFDTERIVELSIEQLEIGLRERGPNGNRKSRRPAPPLWDGKASERIVKVLATLSQEGNLFDSCEKKTK